MFEIYKNKKVLVFGNTGFVGANLCLYLQELGAEVIGFSNKKYIHSDKLALDIKQHWEDIKTLSEVANIINCKPDIIINLAAQPLVKTSYDFPAATYRTNILGTLNILESLRLKNNKCVFLNITSDKCYKNKEQEKGYIESDELNGTDPYSNSKSCAELITQTYQNCFFNQNDNTLVATLRSGNIVGMGDFGEYRLIPDIMRTWKNKEKLIIRYPHAIRPWIFVLDTITGYLKVGEKLLEGKREFAEAWNFSPEDSDMITVLEMVALIRSYIDLDIEYEIQEEKIKKETVLLKLNSNKARTLLDWKPLYNIYQTIEKTVEWYKEYYDNGNIITHSQIKEYVKKLV